MTTMTLKVDAQDQLVLESYRQNRPSWGETTIYLIFVLLVPPLVINFSGFLKGEPAWVRTACGVLATIPLLAVHLEKFIVRTATLDLNSQRAICSDKLWFMQIRKRTVDLRLVNRVLIDSNIHPHYGQANLLLDTLNNIPFRIYSFEYLENAKALGNKVGDFLNKPVVLKQTMEESISEKIIQ